MTCIFLFFLSYGGRDDRVRVASAVLTFLLREHRQLVAYSTESLSKGQDRRAEEAFAGRVCLQSMGHNWILTVIYSEIATLADYSTHSLGNGSQT